MSATDTTLVYGPQPAPAEEEVKKTPRAEEPKTEVRVGKDARLHEKVVKKVAVGTLTPVKARRPRRTAKDRKAHAMTRIKVVPQVWAEAMRLADKDRYRIQVLGTTEVIVWNNANWRTRT